MKNLLCLMVTVFTMQTAYLQSTFCPNNIIINGDLEIGSPTAGDQDIDNASGFSRIWAGGSLADYYTASTGPGGSIALPTPATGNYAACWIANYNPTNTTYREGFKIQLMYTLPANTGSYTMLFDMACLGGWGSAEVGVYGLRNPGGTIAATPTGSNTPTNMNLFGASNTVLLSTIPIATTSCNNLKSSYVVTINTNAVGYPVGGITHLFITHSGTSISGARFMGFDNFCLKDTSTCPANYLLNGNLEAGLPPGGDQAIDGANFFSRIWGTGSLADYYIATSAAGGFTPPTPATGDYISCWIANNNSGGTTYREGFKSELASPILANSGSYELTFDLACLHRWGISELSVYGVDNSSGVLPATPTGAFTPTNPNLFGPGNTVLLGTINLAGSCSNAKINQSIIFNSNGVGFPTSGITHFFITHSDNSAFDNFCLHSFYQPPCPEITNTNVYCTEDINGDGVPDYNLQITVSNSGILNLNTSCGTLSPASIPVTAGVYNISLISNGSCSPFWIQYQSMNSNQEDCLRDTVYFELPPCHQEQKCLCDELSFYDNVNLGFNALLGCPNDIFTPIALLDDCDRIDWYIDGAYITTTAGPNPLINAHITGSYELCMEVTRVDINGDICKHTYCRKIESSIACRAANVNLTPNPAQSHVALTWDTKTIPSQLSIAIYNANGIEVKRLNFINGNEGQITIDIQDLQMGFYFLKIDGPNYAPTPIKFMKK